MKPIFTLFIILTFARAYAQEKTSVCTTKFVPKTYTYNSSPNPNECWEAVSHGILIKTKTVQGFFSFPHLLTEELKKIIDTNEVVVEVVYFDEHVDDSEEDGSVLKITMNGLILYDARKP